MHSVVYVWIWGLAMVLTGATMASGATYFLAPDGDDAGDGSRDQPWRSVERANEAVEPGDTVTFLPGEYAGTIQPARSGREGEPITYRSAERWQATLIARPGDRAVRMRDRDHITIDGFTVDGRYEGEWLHVNNCRHFTVQNCRMIRADGAHGVFEIANSEQVRILDNILSADRTSGNMVHLHKSEHVLMEGNSLTRVGHNPLQMRVCRNVVIRANVFHNDWGRHYAFLSTARVLIERNVITQNRDSARSADSRAKNLYHEGIFRFNRVFDNRHTPLNSGSYFPASTAATPTGYFREPFRMVNSRIYHNTIADNLGFGWELWGMNVSANRFQNNIFYHNDWTGGNVQLIREDSIADDNQVLSNLFRGTEAGQAVIRYKGEHWTVEQANNNTRTWRNYWTEFGDNVDADPAFVDPSELDYRLSSVSEAIDAGRPLALAVGEGESDVMPVTDGVPFFDGFGIEGEQGDWIMVVRGGERQVAQIERVELRDYLDARLHLDRSVQWEDGDPVSLPWSGKMPDQGAYQHVPAGPYAVMALAHHGQVSPGEPVAFEAHTGQQPIDSVQWVFDDGHRTDELSPTHAFDQPGDYGVTLRVVFEDGTRAVDAAFVKVRDPDPSQPLVEVDFEEDTYRDKWGYHFKFYRGWLTGYERVDREDGQGKAMHLFYADKANRAAGALAPGIWQIEDYPYIRFSYRVKPGTPVAICVEPFEGPDQPAGFLLGGTDNRKTGDYIDLDEYELIADGEWHEITVDLRHIHDEMPELEHLYRFMFYTQWSEDEGQEFWFDDFAILPATER